MKLNDVPHPRFERWELGHGVSTLHDADGNQRVFIHCADSIMVADVEGEYLTPVFAANLSEIQDIEAMIMRFAYYWLGSTDPEKWEDGKLANFAKKHFEIRKDQTPVQVGRDVAEALEWDL